MRILFLGDSITDVGRKRDTDTLGEGYPVMIAGKLSATYPNQYNITNRGVNGDRIVDIYARIKKDAWNLNPEIISILVGVNDVGHELCEVKNGVDAERFECVYRMLIKDTLKSLPNVKIIIMEPFLLKSPIIQDKWSIYHEEVLKRAEIAKKISKEFDLCFVPLQKMFDGLSEAYSSNLWSADGVHPTPAGHYMIAQKWIEAFTKL